MQMPKWIIIVMLLMHSTNTNREALISCNNNKVDTHNMFIKVLLPIKWPLATLCVQCVLKVAIWQVVKSRNLSPTGSGGGGGSRQANYHSHLMMMIITVVMMIMIIIFMMRWL